MLGPLSGLRPVEDGEPPLRRVHRLEKVDQYLCRCDHLEFPQQLSDAFTNAAQTRPIRVNVWVIEGSDAIREICDADVAIEEEVHLKPPQAVAPPPMLHTDGGRGEADPTRVTISLADLGQRLDPLHLLRGDF